MIHFFKELFEYSHHFNQQLAAVFEEQAQMTSENSVKLFNHILNAHQVWNRRIVQDQNSFGVWEMHNIQDLKDIDQANYAGSIHILDQFDLNRLMKYSNSKGQVFTNSVRDILFHIINHSTYHRGQIAAEFRQNGIVPLLTDYIFYKR